jgi:hypothetical protein
MFIPHQLNPPDSSPSDRYLCAEVKTQKSAVADLSAAALFKLRK